MQQELIRNQVHDILDKLPEPQLISTLNYLKLIEKLPADQLEAFEDLLENVGWSILASEVAEKEWQ
jgi:hypothetical protein